MKLDYRAIERAIGYRFRKKRTLELALTHPSFRYENPEEIADNQRLEYLGDAVLGCISAEHLFLSQPDANEGEMSKLRSRLTEDRMLAEIGETLELGPFLRLGRGEKLNGGDKRASNLADAVEALLGAAWIDGGPQAVKRIFKKIFLPTLNALQADDTLETGNPKGDLQEYAQSHGDTIPVYETIAIDGPEHDRRFTIRVTACDQQWQAKSTSRRKAERLAAIQALQTLTQKNR